jgi:hypothetical protein
LPSQRGRLSAAAFAEFYCGFVRGMIAHVSSSFQLFTMPRGDLTRRRGFSFS